MVSGCGGAAVIGRRVACAVLAVVLAAGLWVPVGVGAQSADGEAVGSASWSSVLSVGVDGSAAPVVSGFSLWSGLGSLSGGARFELGGAKGRVLALMDYGDGLLLSLSAMPGSDFSLVVDGVEFAASQGLVPSLPGRARFWWPLDRVLWSGGDEVDVELRVVAGGSALGARAAAPPWAWLRGFPGSHEGAGALWVDMWVSEPVAAGAGEVRGSVRVIGGALDRVQRRDSALGDRWALEVVPDGDGDVTVWLDTSQGCAALGWWCTGDGRDVHNSPQFTVAGPASATRLASLALDGFDLDSAFDPDRALHTAWVPDGVETVTVHAAAAHPDATVSVSPADADPDADGHQVAVASGAQTVITITVTAGTKTDTYWLVVDHGGDPDDAPGTRSAQPARSGLSGLAVDGVDPISFDPQTHRYELPAPTQTHSARTHTVVTGLDDTDATVEVLVVHGNDTALGWDPADADPDTPGHQITLADRGDTLILIRVTSTHGRHQQIYALLIQTPQPPTQTGRAATKHTDSRALGIAQQPTVPQLASLTLTGAELAPAFAPATIDYTATAAHDTARVTVDTAVGLGTMASVTPADADPNTPGHQIDLAAPEPGGTPTTTAIAVAVRTTDNQLTTYTITVKRAPAEVFSRDPLNDIVLERDGDEAHWTGLWSNGTTMWVAERWTDTLYAYDLATRTRTPNRDIDTLAAANNYFPEGLWSDGTTMWVADMWRDTIYAYELATGARVPDRDIEPGLAAAAGGIWGPLGAHGLWSDGTTVWASDPWRNALFAYDLATGSRRRASDIGTLYAAGNSWAQGLWSDGATMWVADKWDGKLYAYHLDDGARRPGLDFDTLGAAGNNEPKHLWSDGTTMWVTDASDDKIYAYNMPASSALQSLEFAGTAFEFSKARRGYEHRLPRTTSSTTVVATPADPSASVTIHPADADPAADGHQIEVAHGENAVSVTVESIDGTSVTVYSVRLVRTAFETLSDDSALNELTLSDIDFGVFASDETVYSGYVANSVAETTVVASPAVRGAAVTIEALDADPATDGHQVELVPGVNTVKVSVRSTDGTTRTTYTVRVVRASVDPFGWNWPKDIRLEHDGSKSRWTGTWSNGATMWVVDATDDKIVAYDLATGNRQPGNDIDTLAATGNTGPLGLWSDGSTVWVADDLDDKVYAYDLATGDHQPDRDIDALGASGNTNPSGLWSDGSTMWVADSIAEAIFAYDLATGSRRPAMTSRRCGISGQRCMRMA